MYTVFLFLYQQSGNNLLLISYNQRNLLQSFGAGIFNMCKPDQGTDCPWQLSHFPWICVVTELLNNMAH